MEPRIATLLDQSPYKRFTLDPSVLTVSSVATRHAEPSSSVDKTRLNRDSWAHNDQVEHRNKPSSQSQSSVPIARVLNDPASPSHVFQSASCRQTPQHAAFRIRAEESALGTSTTSPDARRRDESHSSIGIPVGDSPLIQLPKPPQVSRKTTKRPRIPPLLQGLHQPPPLPPKSRLFPPITSDRNGLVKDVGDRFGHGNAFSTASPEELTTIRAELHKRSEAENHDTGQKTITKSTENEPIELDPVIAPKADRSSVTVSTNRTQSQSKLPRKRTRWSQKETEDLLTGVSRFGIGRWKQILNCADFQFQGRTAVDLKDRFRVCRPGEGLKAKKATASENLDTPQSNGYRHSSSESRLTLLIDKEDDRTIAPEQRRVSEEPNSQSSAAPTAMNKTEIHGPFLKSKRRARREFSETDDKNLLDGFKRYGPVWHSMRDDIELGFGTRHPTDLRDRFRIRYPDLFAQAGYKLKPKEERVFNSRTIETKAKEAQVSLDPETTIEETRHSLRNVDIQHKTEKPVTPAVVTTVPNLPSVVSLIPVTTPSQPDLTRPTFDLITDLTFDDDDDDEDQSPIVLNRNILQWADENSSSLPSTSTASANIHAATHNTGDVFYNSFTASDGLHINPLATLKLPSTAHWNYMNHSTAPPPSLPPPGSMKHSLPTHADRAVDVNSNRTTSAAIVPNTTAVVTTGTVTSRTMSDMRTPNLPNIVFPYVPNASARNAVHNLPPPADILSSGQAGGPDGWVWIG